MDDHDSRTFGKFDASIHRANHVDISDMNKEFKNMVPYERRLGVNSIHILVGIGLVALLRVGMLMMVL